MIETEKKDDLIELDDTELDEVIGGAATMTTQRSFNVIAGNGGRAWFQLFWPNVTIAG